MARMRALPLAVALLLGLAGIAPAQSTTGSKKENKNAVTTIRVAVTVLDTEGKPLPNAGVVLRQTKVFKGRMAKDPFNVEIHTNDKGKAVVQGFAPGWVEVQVIAHGFQTYGQNFIMTKANENVEVKMKPPRSQVTIYH